MADPKYASLPGIDRDNPDVFETYDLPEADQDFKPSTGDAFSDAVEQISVPTDEAFNRFKDKSLYPSGTDFSDQLAKTRTTGYYIPRAEYELLPSGQTEPETLAQKLQRLQLEAAQLQEDIAQAGKSLETGSPDVTPSALSDHVAALSSQLSKLQVATLTGPEARPSLADPHNAVQKKLTTHLDSFAHQAASKTSGDAAPSDAAQKGHVTYELYFRPEHGKFQQTQKVSGLETRLQRLEAMVGSSPEKLAVLAADTRDKTLLSSVSLLESKLSLLEPAKLQGIEGRLAALNHKITQTQEKRQGLEDQAKLQKINELYELVKKWTAYSETLPHIVDRMTSLRQLHEQALQFSQALAQLDTAQQQLTANLNTHSDLLTQVDGNLKENMETVKKNISSLSARFDKLGKKK